MTGSPLTDGEDAFRRRIVARRKLYLIFSLSGVAVGLALAIHATIAGAWTASRFVILILVLLLSRSHLRQYRTATVLTKLSGGESRQDLHGSE